MPKQMHFSRHEPFLLQFSFSSLYFSMWALIPDSSKGQWFSDPTDKHLIQHFEIFPSLLQPIRSWPLHHIPHHLLAPLRKQLWYCVDEKKFSHCHTELALPVSTCLSVLLFSYSKWNHLSYLIYASEFLFLLHWSAVWCPKGFPCYFSKYRFQFGNHYWAKAHWLECRDFLEE